MRHALTKWFVPSTNSFAKVLGRWFIEQKMSRGGSFHKYMGKLPLWFNFKPERNYHFLWPVIVYFLIWKVLAVRGPHYGYLGPSLLSFYHCKIVLNDPRPQFYALMTLSVLPVQILVHLLLHLGRSPLPHTVLHQLVEILLRQAHTPLHDNILIMILKNINFFPRILTKGKSSSSVCVDLSNLEMGPGGKAPSSAEEIKVIPRHKMASCSMGCRIVTMLGWGLKNENFEIRRLAYRGRRAGFQREGGTAPDPAPWN